MLEYRAQAGAVMQLRRHTSIAVDSPRYSPTITQMSSPGGAGTFPSLQLGGWNLEPDDAITPGDDTAGIVDLSRWVNAGIEGGADSGVDRMNASNRHGTPAVFNDAKGESQSSHERK